jgi:hypothetical protein
MLLNELRRRSDLRAVYVSMCLQLGMSTCLRATIPPGTTHADIILSLEHNGLDGPCSTNRITVIGTKECVCTGMIGKRHVVRQR